MLRMGVSSDLASLVSPFGFGLRGIPRGFLPAGGLDVGSHVLKRLGDKRKIDGPLCHLTVV